MLDYNSKSVKRWQSIVDDFNNSKLRPKEYCEQHNLSHKTLYNWRHKFNLENKSRKSSDKFVTISFDKEEEKVPEKTFSSPSWIHIKYKNQFEIDIDKRFDENSFLRIIKLFDKISC